MKTYIKVVLFFIVFLIANVNLALAVGDDSCEEFSPDTDAMGVKDDCNDHCFGSLNESIRLRRMNQDAFDTEYKVIHQWCWTRWFDGDCKFCFFFVGCSSTWGPKRTASFGVDELVTDLEAISPAVKKVVFTRHVCLFSYPPKSRFKHSESTYGGTLTVNGAEMTNMNITNRTIVCAYSVLPTTPCTSPFWSWNTAKVGCVHAPIKPGPQTYNKVIPPGTAPIVDNSIGLEDTVRADGVVIPGYLSLGSKFDQPIIKLDEIAGIGTVEKSLILRYKFPGDPTVYDDKPQCGKIPGSSNTVRYCAKIPESDTAQICICEESKCSEGIYLGCVPRPTPKQSKYRIVADYVEHYDPATGTASPSASVVFARLTSTNKVRFFDANNNPCAKDDVGNKFRLDASENLTTTPAVEPTRYDKLFYPNPGNKIREFYELYDPDSGSSALMRDMDTVYGVELMTIIPQFNPAPPENSMKTAYVITPAMRLGSDRCGTFSLSIPSDQTAAKYYLPAGNRIRSYCCPPGTPDPTTCTIPPVTPCNDGSILPHDPTATLAYCPGLYNGPVDVGFPDKICVISEMSWNFIDATDEVCASVPISCDPVNSPNQRSGYSIWPTMDPGQHVAANCDANFGLANREKVSVVKVNPGSNPTEMTLATAQCNAMNDALGPIKATYDALNMNIPNYLLPNGIYCQYQKTSYQVEKICSGGTIGGSIRNPCRFAEGCVRISSSADFTGWATWPDKTDITTYITPSPSANNQENTTGVTGTCSAPHTGSSTRSCYTLYKYPTAGGTLTKLHQRWLPLNSSCN